MAGRPRRLRDESLARRVNAAVRERGLSYRALSAEIGVNVTTLTRSLKEKAFSKSLAVSLERHALPAGPKKPGELQEVLLLLRQLGMILKKAEGAVAGLLDPPDASE